MAHLLDRDVAPSDRVLITDRSINCGDMYGRAAILKEIRDDEDGYDYRVEVTDLIDLVTYKGKYETWVRDVVPEATNIARHPSVEQ